MNRIHARTLCAAGVAVVLLMATGCAADSRASDAESLEAARSTVADVSRGLYRHGTDTFDDYARWADADTQGTNVELIGYEPYAGAVRGDALGSLQFRITMQRPQQDAYVACFESMFDYWGVFTTDRTDREDDAEVAAEIECPPNATRITPPADTRPVYVIPEGTEELVTDVLANAPVGVTAEEITGDVTNRLLQPTGEREVPFEPRALVVDGAIGFAMGDADDCLLVKRDAAGVQVLHVPDILLQPGELGCSPDTALRPVEQLQSPH